MQTNVADEIRLFAAREYIQPARRRGLSSVQIRVGDVHRALKLRNRVPNVSSALRSKTFLEANHLEIEGESGPPSGMGTRTTFTYRLVGEREVSPTGKVTFQDLRGLLKGAFDSLGGGEAFLRRERSHFYDPDPEER